MKGGRERGRHRFVFLHDAAQFSAECAGLEGDGFMFSVDAFDGRVDMHGYVRIQLPEQW